jgi:hypothetical protein
VSRVSRTYSRISKVGFAPSVRVRVHERRLNFVIKIPTLTLFALNSKDYLLFNTLRSLSTGLAKRQVQQAIHNPFTIVLATSTTGLLDAG